ncbi:hypothetical protein [Rhodococcus sp. NPDC058514]|uniref:hypothetical protein n=1 Tax=unclassified Rhodococcus (in: high G+C Gram-positive bacteria) TaxID=192944 RepID=UPI00364B318E
MLLPILRASAIAVAATALAIGTSSVASAANPASLSIDGHLQPIANLDALHIVATGEQDADGKVTGTYNATGDFLPIAVSGPVTCLSVAGNTASLIYPITGVYGMTLPQGLNGAAAVQVTVTKGTDGQPNHVGVIGPMATDSFKGCAPGPTPFVFDGTIEITGG